MISMEPRLPQVALSVSALVNTYCKINANCAEDRDVRDIIASFDESLRYNCMIRESNEMDSKNVLMALKALGNIGHAVGAADTINRCVINDNAPMTIRLAAINAFRRMPCEAEVCILLLKIS